MTERTETASDKGPEERAKPQVGKWIGIGIGAGIGSAAIAAALLYAGNARKKPERK